MTGAAGMGLAWGLSGLSPAPVWAAPTFAGNPFTLGVASGDPLPDGVVLWTRLAPEPLAEDGKAGMPEVSVPVRWEVSDSDSFRRIVARGVAQATPELGHSVHVEVGGLLPDRVYHYRFRAGRESSPVGRTRTAPAAGTAVGGLTFAFASCQSYTDGYYTAYRHLAEEDLDLVVHLGDYIYEGGGSRVRAHAPSRETVTLADYRIRYAQYKTDADLQAAHLAFPWLVTWDDHEVDNNWADDISQDYPDVSPEDFLVRRAAAVQAFYENLPLRASSLPTGPDMRLFRRYGYGALADFHVLDGRQYRDDQACGDGRQVDCEERLDPTRTMLGEEQESWLLDGMAGSTATWNVLANQVFMFQADHEAGPVQAFGMDTWDGYAAARQRLLSGVAERGVDNVVVVTGDAHRSVAADLTLDFDDPDAPAVATELLGTSITSGGDGADQDNLGGVWLAENPHMKFHNAQRGYVRCALTPETYQADYRVVPYVTRPDAEVFTRASIHVEAGRPGIQQVEESPVRGAAFSATFESETERDARLARRR